MDTTASPASAAVAAPTSTSTASMTLTPAAVAQVKHVLHDQNMDGAFLVVRVVPSGCSGLGYDLNLVKDAKADDLTWEQDGVKMATDAMSRQYLQGTVVDFVTTDTAAGFKFNNPNARSTCGCGNSFSA